MRNLEQCTAYEFKSSKDDEASLLATAFKVAGKIFTYLFQTIEQREIEFDFPGVLPRKLFQGKPSVVRSIKVDSDEPEVGLIIHYYADQKRVLFYVWNPFENSIWRGDASIYGAMRFNVYYSSLDPKRNQRFKKLGKILKIA
jgi:hypothetical protein